MGAVIFSMLLSSFGYYAYQVLFSPNVLVDQPPRGIKIHNGTTFSALIKQLIAEEALSDAVSFAFLAKLLDYDEHIAAGYYELQANMSNLSALHMLRSGRQSGVRVSFHGLRLLEELPTRLEGQLLLSSSDLLPLLCADSVAQRYGFTLQSFPLMFIPNTYELYWTISPEAFLARMKSEYERFWSKARRAKADSIGLSRVEIGVLASIVQAETTREEEKRRIAGVYINRLRSRMPLGADPTLIYAWKDFSTTRVLYRHKEINSPYNTYRRRGLPPGPINLPEISSIDAVLEAETHKYLYFCAKDDFRGYHFFSEDFETHQIYARRYRHALNQRRRDSL